MWFEASDPSLSKGMYGPRERLQQTFADHSIESVIHFAGLKAVGEPVSMPLEYYDDNINGTQVHCAAMREAGIKKIVCFPRCPISVSITGCWRRVSM